MADTRGTEMLTRPSLDPEGRVGAVITDRYGGVSQPPYDELDLGARGDDPERVAENRKRVAAGAGIDPASVVWMRQVHGGEVVRADHGRGSEPPQVDGLVCATPDVPLAVLAADCVPVLVADPEAGVLGAAHAGRRGLTQGVAPALVRRMGELGAEPSRAHVLLGPAICGPCYEVPAAMRDEVAELAPAAHCVSRRDTPALDLRAGVEEQLSREGFARVGRDPRCTYESRELFSCRRDGRTGLFASYIWLPGGETTWYGGGER